MIKNKPIGHKSIITYLKKVIQKKILAHAYIFHGVANIGKFRTALWFAQAIICQHPKKAPCYQCQRCQLFLKNIYPDFYLVKSNPDKQSISIKQIREFQKKITKSPFYNSYKIAIIKNSENLSLPSANAFLKTLEEPVKNTIFILTTNNLNQNLPTIISRAESIKFFPIKKRELVAELDQKYNSSQKEFIAKICQGKIEKALKLNPEKIKQIVEKNKEIIQILKSPIFKKINWIDQAPLEKINYLESNFLFILRDILLAKLNLKNLNTIHYLNNEFNKIAQKHKIEQIKKAINYFLTLKHKSKYLNQKLLWQNLLLKI